jgi:hypothetical protein
VKNCITSETPIQSAKGTRADIITSVAASIAGTMLSKASGGTPGRAGCAQNCARVTPPRMATTAVTRLRAA